MPGEIQPSLGMPGEPPRGDVPRLADDWADVQIPGRILAEMLGCRESHLGQNWGKALVRAGRGLYRLDTVRRVVELIHARQSRRGGRSGVSPEDMAEYWRLRNEKLKVETERIRRRTHDAIERVRRNAADEILDELEPLIHEFREKVANHSPEAIEAHNAWCLSLAREIEQRRAALAALPDDEEALASAVARRPPALPSPGDA